MTYLTISAYIYRADVFCPACIVGQLRVGPGQDFDGWALAEGVTLSVESNLDEIAAAFGIDRYDEVSYDSDYFPKVVFGLELDDSCACGSCGEAL